MEEENTETISRKIIHLDMDAFFASVEQRDNPALIGKPVVVGGSPKSRGVVCTCSYEARVFGIHSAMPCSKAYQLCPQAIFVPVRMDAYKEASLQIREIFQEYTELVEPLSLDEAFLDVTHNKMGILSASIIAQQIQQKIFERTGLTASAGVSFNKFIAKIASDYRKPNGITVIPPGKELDFLDPLPVRKFFGVGKVTEQKMIAAGIEYGADMRNQTKSKLIQLFGNSGDHYYNLCRGIDFRAVRNDRTRKSIGRESTLREDTDDVVYITDLLGRLSDEVVTTIKNTNKHGHTVTLKVKYSDFKTITRSKSYDEVINSRNQIMSAVDELLKKTEVGARAIRLIGVTIGNFDEDKDESSGPVQLTFLF